MSDEIQDEAANKLRQAITDGAQIAGAGFAAVTGFLMGGPVGAGAGAVAGTFLGQRLGAIGLEVVQRHLSPREAARVGAVVAAAAAVMRDKLEHGQRPRSDGFFEPTPDGRSSAEEVTEGILVAAQREHEEKKIPLMGRLLANVAFDPSISRAQANFLVAVAEGLSYRSLCILTIIAHTERRRLRDENYKSGTSDLELSSLLTEITWLYGQGLLMCQDGVVFGPTYVWPARLRLQGVGNEIYRLMELPSQLGIVEDCLPIASGSILTLGTLFWRRR
jgi:hypothetical protein